MNYIWSYIKYCMKRYDNIHYENSLKLIDNKYATINTEQL